MEKKTQFSHLPTTEIEVNDYEGSDEGEEDLFFN